MKFHAQFQRSFVHAAVSSSILIALTLFGAAVDAAQTPRPRVATPVNDGARTTLSGSVPSLARPEFDRGEALTSTELTHVRLYLSRTREQETALDEFLDQLQDKSSAKYHQWITPEEFGKRFGPADEDVDAITSWLESEGFSHVSVPKGRMTIEFSGPVGLMETVFHTSIHTFNDGEQEFLANVTEPSIPSALTPVVTGIVHMDTIQPRSFMVDGPRGRYDVTARKIAPPLGEAGSENPRPEYTTIVDGRTLLAIVAGDAATQYNTPNKKLNANFNGSESYDGTGIVIGIGGVAAIETTPIASYRKLFVGDSKTPTITNVDGVTSTNAQNEAYLDIEVAGGIAPGAAIHFYTATDLTTMIDKMLDDNTVDIFNLSFGICEQQMGNTLNQTVLDEWKQAAAQGIAVVAASGDSGSAGCDSKNSDFASSGLGVSGYTSTAFNISVGGSDTYGLVNNFNTSVSATTSASDLYRTLLKPIPEAAWNDSQATPAPLKENVLGNHTIHSGGGGASSCSAQSSAGKCTAGYAKPSWQSGKGVPADRVRDTPDISLMSGAAQNDAIWLVCESQAGATCTESAGHIFSNYSGGTSAAAPAFAGMLALVEQKMGKRLGQAAAELYTLANGPYASKVFNDITLGNNSVPCDPGSPSCEQVSLDNFFMSAYNAGAGYDQATGLGTVNATNLVTFWDAALPQPATVTVRPAEASEFRGSAFAVTVTVSGKAGTPTGTIRLSGGGFTSAAATLAGGKAVVEVAANALTAGLDTLTASYSGDSKYSTASGGAKVTITQLTPTVTVTPAAATVSRAKPNVVTVKVTATIGLPTGSVTLSGGGYKSAATALVKGEAKITIPANRLTAGNDTLNASYAGSPDYRTASGHKSVTVTK